MSRRRVRKRAKGLLKSLTGVPAPLILACGYALFVAFGAVLFRLPFTSHEPIGWSDAIFTATSAVTVTGLSVFDVGSVLTFWGELVLVLLIQVGGLGLMVFAVLVLSLLGLPVGLTSSTYLQEDLGQSSVARLKHLLATILKVVLACEVAGALFLALTFVPHEGVWAGLWTSVFHSVSAFNNAGFSTYAEGLVPFATDPVINIVIPALFITGGIGYVVLDDLFRRAGWRHYTLHTKIMLLGTAILIPWAMLTFAVLEWNNPATLGALESTTARLAVSWFQAVTPRTAGFNTTDIAGMHDSTALMFISLMLIGGGPTSTAGGIKVTTFVVMLLATVAFFRRQSQLSAFGRSIGLEQVLKVMALTAISVILVFVAVFLVVASHDGHFLDIAFEVVSCFATVGLSRGYTPELTEFGRGVFEVVMFLGRVGPLTLGYFLATRSVPRVRYPEGQIHLG
ncbi:TrkH family potassium uptake protein [Oceanicola sp. 502str15]|uniref:TrkH family potassium uptake protein n=1 Tax=Oceanicola sp. 502str15 TaxID=2696061 RepID=UPI002094CC59|nr:TrkH family potassium uptake protein [Oceanicola sp. 502str15]